MSITELSKRAIVCRLDLLLVAIVLCWFGLSEARAQTPDYSQCYNLNNIGTEGPPGPACPTRQAAYEEGKKACEAYVQRSGFSGACGINATGSNYYRFRHIASNGFTVIRAWASVCPAGSSWDEATKTCACPSGQIKNSITGQCMESCSARPEFTESQTSSTGQYIPNGSVGCSGGCQYVHYNNADGTATGTFLGDESHNHCFVTPTCEISGWYLSPGTGMCQPPKPECKANQTKNPVTGQCVDSCPAGMILGADGQCEKGNDTCPAGQVRGPDGSCVQDSCPAGQTKGADGSCKKDSDNDKDDGDEDRYFSGGDNCSAPPQCSGDPILCGQARIQWRIDCNTRRNTNISGGSCAAVPICTGEKCDAMEYAQLLQQWRGTCALEKIAKGEKGEGEDKQPGWTKVDGMNQDPGAGQNPDDVKGVQTRRLSTGDLDSSGWLGGAGSCPAIMAGGAGNGIGSSFAQALASPPGWFCNFVAGMAAIIMMIGAVTAGYILSRG